MRAQVQSDWQGHLYRQFCLISSSAFWSQPPVQQQIANGFDQSEFQCVSTRPFPGLRSCGCGFFRVIFGGILSWAGDSSPCRGFDHDRKSSRMWALQDGQLNTTFFPAGSFASGRLNFIEQFRKRSSLYISSIAILGKSLME